jgi:RNA polymerase sigma-70 factor, ECF subfamily
MAGLTRNRSDGGELRFNTGAACPAEARDDETELVGRAIARAKGGDRDAIRFLYIRYADNVYGYAKSLLRDEHEAEDVTQQVFAKLITAIRKYEQRETPFMAWILRVTYNLTIDNMRRQRMVPCEEVRAADESEEPSYDRAQCIKAALAELPHDQREVLVLRHLVGLSPGEIAERLGKTEGSIHGLHHRGRGTLKTVLADLDVAPATAG